MSVEVKYVKTPQDGVGFITHNDQQIDGIGGLKLKFNIITMYDGFNYVKIEGEEQNIEQWKVRVEGEYVSLEQIDQIIQTFPKPIDQQLQNLKDFIELIGNAVDDIILNN